MIDLTKDDGITMTSFEGEIIKYSSLNKKHPEEICMRQDQHDELMSRYAQLSGMPDLFKDINIKII